MAAAATPMPRRRLSPAGMVNLSVLLAVVLVIIPLALHAAQPPPPAIAELAPSVQQQTHLAPTGQGAVTGRGPSGAGSRPSTPPPAPPPPPAAATPEPSATPLPPGGRPLHCVGTPPRQTEDPQSP